MGGESHQKLFFLLKDKKYTSSKSMSIELYALGALLGIGYLFTQKQQPSAPKNTSPDVEFKLVPASEIPSTNTVYDSRHFEASQLVESHAARDSFKKANDPKRTGVISRSYRDLHGSDESKKKKYRSALSGVELEEDNFRHNNMTPFFGSRVKQNLRASANRTILETFTGNNNDVYRTKHEIGPMFKATANFEGVHGNAVAIDKHLDRFEASRMRNNEKPFESKYVAPGLAQQGYGSKGTGGFHQFYDNQRVLRPKTVDDLRVGNNKKETYEGRFVPGAGIGQRGFVGAVHQNRQKVLEEHSPLRYFVTAAGNEAAKQRPDVVDPKPTERMTSSVPYMGDAFGGIKASTLDKQYKASERQEFEDFGFRNVAAGDTGRGEENDHGRDSMHLPAQERDLTSEKTYQGNLTTLVKAIIAPLEDMLRIGRKEYAIENPREYGQMSPQMPAMITVKDPNDVARTTIKETLIHDTHEGYIAGPIKLTVYDPEDVARTTIRDTTDQVNHPNLWGGTHRNTTRDPNANMRTTMKETTMAGDWLGGVEASTQGSAGAYLTADVEAKQTSREFLADHDHYGGALSLDGKRPVSYDEYFNAHLNVLREGTLKGRAPVYEGMKEAAGVEDIYMTSRKIAVDDEAPRDFYNPNKLTGVIALDADDAVNFTKDKTSLIDDSRLDPAVLSSLKTNPYAMKPISCAAPEAVARMPA